MLNNQLSKHIKNGSLDLGCIEEVYQRLQTINISDSDLTDVLRQVKVSERAQSDEGCGGVTSFQILDQLLYLPVLRRQIGVYLK